MKNRDYNELTKKIDGMYWDTVDDHDRCKKMLERYVAEELATIEEEKLSYGKVDLLLSILAESNCILDSDSIDVMNLIGELLAFCVVDND